MEVLEELQISISEAYQSAFIKAQQNLKSQLATHTVELQEANAAASIANEARQKAEHRIKDLEREVSALRTELSFHDYSPEDLDLQRLADVQTDFKPNHVLGTKSHDVDRETLESKYTALYGNMQTLAEICKDLKVANFKHRKHLSQFQSSINKEEFTVLIKGAPITYQRVPPTSNFEGKSSASRKSRSTSANFRTSPSSQLGPIETTTTPNSTQNRSGLVTKKTITAALDTQSPQTGTESESSGSHSDVLFPLPDLKTQKRKRDPELPLGQPTGSVPERSQRVKIEPLSSSPTQHYQAYLPSTQDLDDIGDTVQTPTKRQAHRVVHWEDSDSMSQADHAPDSSCQRPRVLQSIDGNAKRLTRFSDQNSGTKERLKATSNYAARTFAEDGEKENCATHSHPVRDTPATQSGSKINLTLQDLLEGPAPTRSPLKYIRQSSVVQHSMKDSSRSIHGAMVPVSQTEPEVPPGDGLYRSLPLQLQTLDHFKINSERNQGIDYAYNDVVRKKDDRRCLTGCTRPGCCGDRFRAMVRFGAPGSLPGNQEEEEQRILEEFVGDERSLLNGLSPRDRANLLVEARARILANQYGRHRHTHQRARTPPGFWRTEMPSTQEQEADRRAAHRLEREKVEERYREAMRPGGLWTFVDE
ncbi:hypothetical protein N7495_008900 [Penicillium taxi]|uniref:uncharacterized protein n=1 Tax=Penicillium taxi TaxID=168475 RepID=UPI0025451953|nr:uncharacterized protein N7495_008900 [Penicillium taxi]KAJ5888859.1 hypothetical protein N7495_008900 [Penicillium taxi]